MHKIRLLLVRHLPNNLQPDLLYVSEEFGIAGHICPCGCNSKVITPLGPNEWSIEIIDDKPSLEPSIGNWQLPCRSHYWITDGEILWSYQWSNSKIKAAYKREEQKRVTCYKNLHINAKQLAFIKRLYNLTKKV